MRSHKTKRSAVVTVALLVSRTIKRGNHELGAHIYRKLAGQAKKRNRPHTIHTSVNQHRHPTYESCYRALLAKSVCKLVINRWVLIIRTRHRLQRDTLTVSGDVAVYGKVR